ncbi:MAG: hypothetical protein RLZZ324_1120, partial [Candidatus Parcubacteria bacterium]
MAVPRAVAPVSAQVAPTTPVLGLEKLRQDTDVLLMLYPKDVNGIFRGSIRPEDEIT